MTDVWFYLYRQLDYGLLVGFGSVTDPIYAPDPSKTSPTAFVSSGSPTGVPVPVLNVSVTSSI